MNNVAGSTLTQEHSRLTYKNVEELEKKIEHEKEVDFRERLDEQTADLDHEAIYKKLNAKSSPIKTGGRNAYFNKNMRSKRYGKRKGAKEGDKPVELDAFGMELKNQRSERNQNFVRQNLKKKYEGRTHGMAYIYKTRFMSNGRSKAFYKNLDETETLETDPKTHKEVEEEFMYKSKSKFDFVKDGAMNEESSVITKENVFFKMINKGMGYLMMNRMAVPSNQRPIFDRNIATLYQQNDWLGADGPNDSELALLNEDVKVQGMHE